jgi:hypothetical protein
MATISEVLRELKGVIEINPHYNSFLCCTVFRDLNMVWRFTDVDRGAARQHIRSFLPLAEHGKVEGACVSLETWLVTQRVDAAEINPQRMREYRLRWLAHLIAELEGETEVGSRAELEGEGR